MTSIRMLRSDRGAPHGAIVLDYAEGEVYPQPGVPVSDELVAAFLAAGACEMVAPAAPEPAQGADDAAATTPADAPEKPATRKRSAAAKASA